MRLPILIVAVVLAAGCAAPEGGTTDVIPEKTITSGDIAEPESLVHNMSGANETPAERGVLYKGTILAGTAAPVIDFNKADYEAAIKTDKVILLYFYANWCPICRAEVPHLYGAFDELTTDKIMAFRVNFNDGDTDNDERALAQQYQVPYQHTKVFIKNSKLISKHPDSWDKERYMFEISKAIE